MIKCNYYNKIRCGALVHNEDKKAVKSLWLSHGGSGLMLVNCCEECAKIANETDNIVCESMICNKK